MSVPIFTDHTGKRMVEELEKLVLLKEHELGVSIDQVIADDWSEVADMAREGVLSNIIGIGHHTAVNWQDVRPGNTTDWQVRLNAMAHNRQVELADGETQLASVFGWHYSLPFGTQFSPYQAFLKAITVIPAGTYNVKMGFGWGSNVINGKSYQFTLTEPVPAGGQLSGFEGAPDQSPANWKVKSWASDMATTPTETVSVTEGSGGTNLGTFTVAGSPEDVEVSVGALRFYGLNSLHRVAYGSNRWSKSPIRQFLNASGDNWYAPQTNYDRTPAYIGYDGFLTGFSDNLIENMVPAKIVTAASYAVDGGTAANPLLDVTYDRVWLPSWEEHYLAVTQSYGAAVGIEGAPFEYWERIAGTPNPLPASTWGQASTYHAEYVQYGLDNKTSPRNVFMRSASRGGGSYVTYVYSTGYCHHTNASIATYVAPACYIG